MDDAGFCCVVLSLESVCVACMWRWGVQSLGAKEGAVKERPVRCEEGRAGMAQHMTTRLTADCNCGIFAMCPLILAVAINEP